MKESKSAVMFALAAIWFMTGLVVMYQAVWYDVLIVGYVISLIGVFFFGFTCGELNQSRGRQTNGKT